MPSPDLAKLKAALAKLNSDETIAPIALMAEICAEAPALIAELEQLAQDNRDKERLDEIERRAKGGVFDWIKVYLPETIIGANAKSKGAYPDLRAAIDDMIAARQMEGK